jgi:hypothetical protein
LEEVLLGLPGKADDHIGREVDLRHRGPQPLDELDKLVPGVASMHSLEDRIGTGLKREMEVARDLRVRGQDLD